MGKTTAGMLDDNQIDLFISPRFLLYSAAMCIDAVRLANREQPDRPLSIRLVSQHGGEVFASNGVPLATQAISLDDSAGTVLVLTSYEPEAACTPEVLKWIRNRYQEGARLACIETAAYVFVRAGLLDLIQRKGSEKGGHKLAAHYEAAPAFREMFGDQISLRKLYHRNDAIYSSAGASSTLDLVLNIIEELRGQALVDRIAYVFNHQRSLPTTRKPTRILGVFDTLDSRLRRIVSLMEASLGTPGPLNDIYRQAGVESSTARRLFKRILKTTPARYYRQLRVEYGREMLQNGALNIAKVSELTGYSDPSSFTRAFKSVYGLPPIAATRRS